MAEQFSPSRLLPVLLPTPRSTPQAAPRRYWVAYSGGCDSHVLLHALVALRSNLPGSTIAAVHVNHGLNARAAEWADHCRATCAQLAVDYHLLQVDATAAPGESPEAVARTARYRAFATLLDEGDWLLTAHHRDDQAETLLLQLLRGAGAKGLAAMPQAAAFSSGTLMRPLLSFSREQLRHYAHGQQLQWIEDDSNQNEAFARNYLRHQIVPRIEQRWPAASRVIARSAAHLAESSALLDELAATDLESVAADGGATVRCSALLTLSPARQRNLLRYWIYRRGFALPSQSHLQHLLSDVVGAKIDAEPCIRWRGAEVRRYRDALSIMTPLPEPPSVDLSLQWQPTAPLRDARLAGTLSAKVVLGAGMKQPDGALEIRFRQGGERCQPTGCSERTTVKKLLQQYAVPYWERAYIPFIYVNGELAAVAGLWVCEAHRCAPADTGLVLHWQRHD
ncbi:MAG: tRNA lysidine(34) synthetase TilS [Gammaproteobacteria bacterium]|nr:tRNA lysidine(34) synthetase TilS [Gammaproteobacteria bacterium]